MSSTRQAVMRGPNLTGLGKVPAFTMRQRVADENGKIAGINWDWRMYPVAGNAPYVAGFIVMSRPLELSWCAMARPTRRPDGAIAELQYAIAELGAAPLQGFGDSVQMVFDGAGCDRDAHKVGSARDCGGGTRRFGYVNFS